ncbi:probable sodium-coupled neutral amino acid transporter 6 [Amphiura filiformis]|uniref:probable sodium-coupled neutral amino acid transporter 6 n=1 Tax=Amphiura filiformis TaxID=82378 RepID=UPI003B2121EF
MEEPDWPTPRRGLTRSIDDAEDFTRMPGNIFHSHSINSPLVSIEQDDEDGEVFVQEGPVRGASFSLSVFNVMNAVLGSGILGLPYAMAKTGIVLFSFLLVVIAVLATFSIHLLLYMCDLTGVKSYEDVGFYALKVPGKLLAAGAIITQNIGSMSSYLFIVKEELPEIFHAILVGKSGSPNPDVWYLNGDYLVLLSLILIILPLSCLPKIGFLGYTSGLSILCMVFFTVVVVIKKWSFPCPIPPPHNGTIVNASLYTEYKEPSHTHRYSYPMDYEIPETNLGNSTSDQCSVQYYSFSMEIAFAIPTMAFSFVCHTAILPIYTELSRPSRSRMQNVANTSVALCLLMYTVTSIFGYLTFYGNIKDELLEGYTEYDEKDKLILTVRLAVVMAIILTIPLVHYPSRKALLMVIDIWRPSGGSFSWIRHMAATVFLLTIVTCLAIFMPNLKEIFGIVGATASCTLVFILPALFYMFLGRESWSSIRKVAACGLLGVGLVVLSVCLSVIIYGLVHPKAVSG